MNKKLIPTVLMATIMIAGISAFSPIDLASTTHTTITTALGTPGGTDIADDIDDVQDQIDGLIQTGSCEQVTGATDPNSGCITISRAGILYIVVDVTIDGTTGLKIQVNAGDVCQDVAIVGADSPFLCVLPVNAADVVTLIDASSDDSAGTADVRNITSPVDPT